MFMGGSWFTFDLAKAQISVLVVAYLYNEYCDINDTKLDPSSCLERRCRLVRALGDCLLPLRAPRRGAGVHHKQYEKRSRESRSLETTLAGSRF